MVETSEINVKNDEASVGDVSEEKSEKIDEKTNKCKIDPDESILAVLLDSRNAEFEKQLRLRHDIWNPRDEVVIRMVSDEKCELTLQNGEVLCEAEWTFLGMYYIDESGKVSMEWEWNLIPRDQTEEKTKKIEKMEKIRKIMKEKISDQNVRFNDPAMISYVQSLMMSEGEFDVIYNQCEEGRYLCFGINKIDWRNIDIKAHKTQLYYGVVRGIAKRA